MPSRRYLMDFERRRGVCRGSRRDRSITESHWIFKRFLPVFELCRGAGWLIVWWSQPSRKRNVKVFLSRRFVFLPLGGWRWKSVQGLVGMGREENKKSANCLRMYHFGINLIVLSFSSRWWRLAREKPRLPQSTLLSDHVQFPASFN